METKNSCTPLAQFDRPAATLMPSPAGQRRKENSSTFFFCCTNFFLGCQCSRFGFLYNHLEEVYDDRLAGNIEMMLD
jgi:hypothetical protein